MFEQRKAAHAEKYAGSGGSCWRFFPAYQRVGGIVVSLRQSLPSQQSPRPFETAEKPRKRGLLRTKLLTVASARNAVFVSLRPIVSKAPDFAILVRNFKRLILNGYSAREIRTFRTPIVAEGSLKANSRKAGLRDTSVWIEFWRINLTVKTLRQVTVG